MTNDFIRVLGAQFTPSDADNHSKLLAELRCRMEKCAQRYRGLEYRARLLITNTFLITIPLFHLQYTPYLTEQVSTVTKDYLSILKTWNV